MHKTTLTARNLNRLEHGRYPQGKEYECSYLDNCGKKGRSTEVKKGGGTSEKEKKKKGTVILTTSLGTKAKQEILQKRLLSSEGPRNGQNARQRAGTWGEKSQRETQENCSG